MTRIAEPPIKSSPRRRGFSNDLSILGSRLRGNDKTILIESFPRPSWRRSTQRGQVLLGIVVILAIVFGGLFYSFVRPASSTIERDKITNEALAQAKEALIGYAVNEARTPNRPGALPCPDTNDDGKANGPLVGTGQCENYLGRLPWHTLDLPDLRDSSGERLWYALSPVFRNWPISPFPGVLNSDTPGELAITGDTTPVIGIVFAPGPVVGSQVRNSPANQNNVANYLECGNEDGDTTYVTSAVNCTLNDKLLPITRDALMSVVEMRVLRTMRAALVAYRATPGNGYPFANPYSDNTKYECAYLQIEGRFPVKMKTLLPSPSGCLLYADWGPELPAWFGNNRWQTVSYYSVDPCKVGSVAGAGGAIVSGLNALCALGLPPKVDGTAKDAVVLVGSNALAAVPGQTPRPCGARSACFEAPNLSGNAFVTPTRSSANNDRLASIP